MLRMKFLSSMSKLLSSIALTALCRRWFFYDGKPHYAPKDKLLITGLYAAHAFTQSHAR